MDEHGALGGDGFVHGGSARFADDEVMGGEEFRDLLSPAFDANAAGIGGFEGMDPAIETAEVAPQNDGDLGVVNESGADDVVDVGRAGGGEEEDAEGGQRSVRGDFWKLLEAGADWESGDLDFFGGDFLGDESFPGVWVGDEEVVTGGAGPGGVDLDGIGDHGDDGDPAPGRELPLDHVGIDGVGVDDEVWLELIKEVCYGVFGLGDEGQWSGKILLVGGVVHPGPQAWGVGGDFPIAAAENAVDPGVAEMAGVGDEDFGIVLEGLGKVSGGAIVPVAEAGSEDEDIGLHTLMHWKRSKRDRELRRPPFAFSISS